MHEIHECNKVFCAICTQNRDIGHLSYMRSLKNVLPSAGDKVLYVFYDFETSQIRRYSDKPTLHYLNSSTCNSSVRIARMRKTWKVACNAARGSTLSWMSWSGTCYYIYLSQILGSIKSSCLRTTPRRLTCVLL